MYSCGFDDGFNRLQELVQSFPSVEDRNEATTRLHLIDSLFFECLGWLKEDVTVEEAQDGEFADYQFRSSRSLLIVEAKREGVHFVLPAGVSRSIISISSLTRGNPLIKASLRQVADYCQHRGVPYGCMCNGHQIVAFVASRSDSVSPLQGNALVFSSLNQMLEEFQLLWDSLSKPGVEEHLIQEKLQGSQVGKPILSKPSSNIRLYPGSKERNSFQTDLQILSELVIEDLPRSNEIEKVFYMECYAQSGALSQYAMVSKSILKSKYSSALQRDSTTPALIPAMDKKGVNPDIVSASISRRPILLIGDVGVGKTSFLKHLMYVELEEIFRGSIALYIDLGTQATLSRDIRGVVVREIEKQLLSKYDVDVREDRFVRGVYNVDLSRFRKGVWGPLQENQPEKFLEKEIEYLARLTEDVAEHLRASIAHISKGRGQQVIIVLDNADQRTESDQQEAFLVAHELSEKWDATVFLPLRPETYSFSVKEGALSGYHPKAFTISPPRIDEVVRKRLVFAQKIARGQIAIPRLQEIEVNLVQVDTLIGVFLESLNRNDDLDGFVDNIASGNVRLALDLVRKFFGSGHVDTKKICERAREYVIPLHEFLRAVIFGDNVYYDPDSSPICNVFDVSATDPREHFLTLLFLSTVHALEQSSRSDGFVETDKVYSALQGLQFMPTQIDSAFVRCHRKRLVETAYRLQPVAGQKTPPLIRITGSGRYHQVHLPRMFVYVDAVAIDTPIIDDELSLDQVPIRLQSRLDYSERFIAYLCRCWNGASIDSSVLDWHSIASTVNNEIGAIRQRRGFDK